METSKLNQTFIPKQILKKASITNKNTLLAANQFEKTAGNSYIEFEPIEVKFNGYELGKMQTALVKIINKSPIPQRVHILPPTQPGFSIKVNKKGPIAAGMSEILQVCFTSDVYKYQYDVVKINSETGNFVVPIYAYPSIPKLQQVFPKLIDFGTAPVNESNSYFYSIRNPVPADFLYQFNYINQSPAFIITPIKGTILANSVQNIQITFIPSQKKTFTADVIFNVKQFDFEPIKIKLMGSGKQKKQSMSTTKRLKSAKLNPLQKPQSKNVQNMEPSLQSVTNPIDLNQTNAKKSFIRSKASFPKLLKKTSTLINQPGMSTLHPQKLQTTFKKQNEREFNSHFSKIQELDKQKDIKFSQFLGDRAMTQQQLQFQNKVLQESNNLKIQNLKDICIGRYISQKKTDGQVDLTKFVSKQVTWNSNKNNEMKIRKQKLKLFMKAGTQIIKKYRLAKRLAKIKQFLSGCRTKQDVRKKVQQDYSKSLDLSKQKLSKTFQNFSFSSQNLQARSFPLQFKDEGQSIKKTFQTEGSTKFDDDKPLSQIEPNEIQIINYSLINFPSDFIYMTRKIPLSRQSAEQQYPLKTAALPQYQAIMSSSVYKLPLKVPAHQFIYNNFELSRYKTNDYADEKDPEYLIDATLDHVQDQFEGWSKGQMDVLKAKFQRNMGCQFTTISQYNYPEYGDIGFLGELGSLLPKQIGNMQITRDDVLDQADSDDQKIAHFQAEKVEALVAKIQEKSKAKERREKKYTQNYEKTLLKTVEKNVEGIKFKILSQAVDKIAQYNKWVQARNNKILI